MAASPSDAFSRAREITQRRLFPFNLEKWLRLGFIAFLAGLGQGGGGSGAGGQLPGLPSGKGASGTGFDWDSTLRQGEEFVRDNFTLVIVGAGVVYLMVLAIGAVITWLSSRAELVFVESVIHDRTAIAEPWRRLSVPGWQLFKARFLVGVVTASLIAILAGVGAVVAWPELRAANYLSAFLRFVPFFSGSLLVAVPAGVFLALLRDFLAPVMYLDGVGVSAAWRTFRDAVISGNIGALVLFYFIKIALGIAAGFVALVATCLTCCFAALPYIGTVVLLPIHVFFRTFSLTMLEELGKPVFPVAEPPQPFKGWF